jgi:hypothetical protein
MTGKYNFSSKLKTVVTKPTTSKFKDFMLKTSKAYPNVFP